MIYFAAAMGLFMLSVLTHMVWCRVRRIQDIAIVSLVMIQLAWGLGLAWAVLFFLPRAFPVMGEPTWFNAPLPYAAIVTYAALMPFYFSFYHAIVVNSPTRLMLDEIKRKPQARADLLRALNEADFIKSRLDALVAHGVVIFKERYTLGPSGKSLARLLDLYQRLVGRPKGG